jgi:hypothetical protein
MDSEVHVNHVLYKKQLPGARPVYRQIAVVEQAGRFEVRVFGGEVVQMDPKFIAESSDAEVHMHPTFTEAMADADSEFRRSVSSRKWEPYDPSFPPKYP